MATLFRAVKRLEAMQDDDHEHSSVADLVGYAYPSADPFEGDTSKVRRRWIVRVHRVLPAGEALFGEAEAIAKSLRGRLRDHFQGTASEAEVDAAIATPRFFPIGTHHLVVEVEFPAPGFSLGDEALLANWGVLREIDQRWQIEDLEGIPKQYWFQLR